MEEEMAIRSTRTSRRVYHCGLYVPGHDVHWIQALRSLEDTKSPAQAGMLIEAHPDGALVIDVAGQELRIWNHDPSRLVRLAARNRGEIQYQPNCHLLRTRARDGSYGFSVAEESERRSCPSSPPSGDIMELLQEAGGFSVPASRLDELLTQEVEQPSEGEAEL
jgi:hypothetical protein